jgi:hypothetical protein
VTRDKTIYDERKSKRGCTNAGVTINALVAVLFLCWQGLVVLFKCGTDEKKRHLDGGWVNSPSVPLLMCASFVRGCDL